MKTVVVSFLCSLVSLAQTAVPPKYSIPIWEDTGGANGRGAYTSWWKFGGSFTINGNVLSVAPQITGVSVTMLPAAQVPSATINGGVLSISIPYPPVTPRKLGAELAYDSVRDGWPLPNPKAANVSLYQNGVRLNLGNDYTLATDSAGLLVKSTSMIKTTPSYTIADYDDVR